MRADARLAAPPGFCRGLLHGAMMPVAWPALLAGHDQEIYAARNEGRSSADAAICPDGRVHAAGNRKPGALEQLLRSGMFHSALHQC